MTARPIQRGPEPKDEVGVDNVLDVSGQSKRQGGLAEGTGGIGWETKTGEGDIFREVSDRGEMQRNRGMVLRPECKGGRIDSQSEIVGNDVEGEGCGSWRVTAIACIRGHDGVGADGEVAE